MSIYDLTVGPNETDNIQFGEILWSFRTRNKLTRAEAARHIEVTSEYIRLIERGQRVPALGTAIKIFEIYGIAYSLDKSRLIFENTVVDFNSRIKESRQKGPKMPAIRYFVVTQTREIRVSANTPTDAVVLAQRVFAGEKKPEDQVNVQSYPREVSIIVQEDR